MASLFSYVEKMRREPVEKRRRAAVIITVIIVGAIALAWFSYLVVRFGIFSGAATSAPADTASGQPYGIESPY